MKSINIRKMHFELYESCRSTVMKSVAEARAWFPISFVLFLLGLTKLKNSNQEFNELQICFNLWTRLNIGYNISVRPFEFSRSE